MTVDIQNVFVQTDIYQSWEMFIMKIMESYWKYKLCVYLEIYAEYVTFMGQKGLYVYMLKSLYIMMVS